MGLPPDRVYPPALFLLLTGPSPPAYTLFKMPLKQPADNQAIASRFGTEAVWLTDFITPQNPDVRLLHEQLTDHLDSLDARLFSLWKHVADIPYSATVKTTLTVGGRRFSQNDTWLLPAETIRLSPIANCANKSFLLASLVRNELPPGIVSCVMGNLALNHVGAHAWVQVNLNGRDYIMETTQPSLDRALLDACNLGAYEPVLYFNDEEVYSEVTEPSALEILNKPFGFCAIPFLEQYLCQRCLELEG